MNAAGLTCVSTAVDPLRCHLGADFSVTRCHPATPNSLTPPLHFLLCESIPTLSLLVLGATTFACVHPLDLECLSHEGGGGEHFYRTVVFAKCKQLILSRRCRLLRSALEIMFIRAGNWCVPLADSTPPATYSFSSAPLVLSLSLRRRASVCVIARDRLLPVEQ